MKMKLTVQELRANFIENGLVTETATLNGEHKVNNKAYNELIKIFKIFEKNIDVAKETLGPVLDSLQNENINTHTKVVAATHALALNIYIKEAVDILEKNVLEKSFYSFTSKMVLEQWRKGELIIYQNKK